MRHFSNSNIQSDLHLSVRATPVFARSIDSGLALISAYVNGKLRLFTRP